MSDGDENPFELPEPSQPLPPRRIGLALPVAALILPVLAGSVGFFITVTSFGLGLAIGAATVVGSALLLAIDAGRLAGTNSTGRRRSYADWVLFWGVCGLWIVFYPLAFVWRRRHGGPNLVIPALLVMIFFLGAPCLRPVFVPLDLPACDSREVVQILDQLIRETDVGAPVRRIDGYREVSYDRTANRRQGQCVVHTDGASIVVDYIVQWRDGDKGRFEVQITP